MSEDQQEFHDQLPVTDVVGEPVHGTVAEPESKPAISIPSWYRHVSTVIFIIFCFEMGLFLVVYPWIDAWGNNYFSMIVPGPYLMAWRQMWNSSYFRGAVSGVGLINIWIAIQEVFGLVPRRGKG